MNSGVKNNIFVSLLLKWSQKNLRDFPWRRTKDSYKIIIAEIMLQRTKANQVAPVFQRFIANNGVEQMMMAIFGPFAESATRERKHIFKNLISK